jgi:brefeldin A-resistance guanine nucleotide exchange factor 1
MGSFFLDISELDASMLLTPFLDVIRSGNTTGPIAGAALSSVEKFLQYGIIGTYLHRRLNYLLLWVC